MISAAVSPANGVCPDSISYSTMPRLKMSVRASVSMPRACRATYSRCGDTRRHWCSLRLGQCFDLSSASLCVSLAKPKSRTLMTPSLRSMTFSGLMSR